MGSRSIKPLIGCRTGYKGQLNTRIFLKPPWPLWSPLHSTRGRKAQVRLLSSQRLTDARAARGLLVLHLPSADAMFWASREKKIEVCPLVTDVSQARVSTKGRISEKSCLGMSKVQNMMVILETSLASHTAPVLARVVQTIFMCQIQRELQKEIGVVQRS